MRVRRGASLGTAVVLSLALSGCVGVVSEPDAPPGASGSEDVSQRVDPRAFADDLRAGLATGTTAQLTQQIDVPVAHLTMAGVADYTTLPADVAGSMDMDIWQPRREVWRNVVLDARLIDGTTYLGRRGRFLSFKVDMANSLGDGLTEFVNLLDPLAFVADAGAAMRSVRSFGAQEIGGEQLTRYEVTFDPRKIASWQWMMRAESPPDEITYSMWVDGEFRVREMSASLEVDGDPLDIKVRLFAWGEPVEIEVPAPDRVRAASPQSDAV